MRLMAILGSDGDDKRVQVDMLCMSDPVVTHVRYLNRYSEVLK